MNIEEYRSYCFTQKGVTESFPFSKLPSTLVFKVLGKMFTAADMNVFHNINVKAKPDEIQELRAHFSCIDIPSYMNKNHWNKVTLDNSVPDDIIYNWIDISYELVIKGMTNKLKQQLKCFSN